MDLVLSVILLVLFVSVVELTATGGIGSGYGPGVVERLKAYGVRWVFVHRANYLAAGWDLPQSVGGLTHIDTIDGVDIYSVD